MRCSEVSSLLELSDVDARLDRGAVGRHLAACSQCACRWPEAVMLLGAAAIARRVRRGRRITAAALVVVGILGIAALEAPDRMAVAGSPAAGAIRGGPGSLTPTPPRVASIAALTRETVGFDRGRRIESRVTSTVWTAPIPKCMQTGGSGS